MKSTQPVTGVEPIETSDSVKKTQHVKDLSEAERAKPAAPARLGPANHVAPAAHANKPNDPAAAAAVSEERGRAAVERIEGSTPVHSVSAGPAPHPVVTVRPHAISHLHLHPDFWDVVEAVRRAHAEDIPKILAKHPDVAAQVAQVFLLSGGASVLEGLRTGHGNEPEPPKYTKPAPETPDI